MKIAMIMFVFLAAAYALHPAGAADKPSDEDPFHVTDEMRESCRNEGGCTVFTRDALIQLIHQVQAADEKACKNTI